jgi:hypothetical protein
MGKDRLADYPHPDGEVFVEDHGGTNITYDTSITPAREVGRTEGKPTRHDGSQETR